MAILYLMDCIYVGGSDFNVCKYVVLWILIHMNNFSKQDESSGIRTLELLLCIAR